MSQDDCEINVSNNLWELESDNQRKSNNTLNSLIVFLLFYTNCEFRINLNKQKKLNVKTRKTYSALHDVAVNEQKW